MKRKHFITHEDTSFATIISGTVCLDDDIIRKVLVDSLWWKETIIYYFFLNSSQMYFLSDNLNKTAIEKKCPPFPQHVKIDHQDGFHQSGRMIRWCVWRQSFLFTHPWFFHTPKQRENPANPILILQY